MTPAVLERHLTPKELAELWGFSENTIRKIFQNRPGVVKLGSSLRPGKRTYISLRIPQSIADQVHRELSVAPSLEIKPGRRRV